MGAVLPSQRSRSMLEYPDFGSMRSVGAGVDSITLDNQLRLHLEGMRALLSPPVAQLASVAESPEKASTELEKQLAEKLASIKRMTANIAMHLDPAWRTQLFASLDAMLDPGDWDEAFALPSERSFSTFLRTIIYLSPTRRPALGLSPRGNFLASWRRGSDRIVVECLPDDEVRWVLSRLVEGERESGAGKVQIHRLPEVASPYQPDSLFADGQKLLA
jgi:hypothetical protein